MVNVLNKYKQTSNSMKAITLHILDNIKKSFKRFLKAHTMQELIKKNSAEMVTI